jgi:hypothetical protein
MRSATRLRSSGLRLVQTCRLGRVGMAAPPGEGVSLEEGHQPGNRIGGEEGGLGPGD